MGFDIGTVNLGFAAANVDSDGGGEILRAEIVNIKASSTDASILCYGDIWMKSWRVSHQVLRYQFISNNSRVKRDQ
jgi:hypothetical protein